MGGEKVVLTTEDQKRLERATMASTEKLYDLDAAPAAMPGLEEATHNDAPSWLDSAQASAWSDGFNTARERFAPILAEKERLDFEVARLAIEADRNETGWNAAEARALAAEAERDDFMRVAASRGQEIERLKEMRKRLDRRIHCQRKANRDNWEIVEQRRRWLGSQTAQRAWMLQRDRRLAAEAALAGERERCAKIAEAYDGMPCHSLMEGQRAEDYDNGQIDACYQHRRSHPGGGVRWGGLTDEQIKAIYKTAGVDFSRGDTWRVPIYRRPQYSQEEPILTPPEDMYVEFRLEDGAFGVPGTIGHRVTRVIGRGVVVEEIHHHDRPVFIPIERP